MRSYKRHVIFLTQQWTSFMKKLTTIMRKGKEEKHPTILGCLSHLIPSAKSIGWDLQLQGSWLKIMIKHCKPMLLQLFLMIEIPLPIIMQLNVI